MLHCGDVHVAQLAEIRKFKYARLMCENADSLPLIQPDIFFHPLSVVNAMARSVLSIGSCIHRFIRCMAKCPLRKHPITAEYDIQLLFF